MKLLVKTLKGEKFHVECEPSQAVSEVKAIVEKEKPELPAASMKLIHSGRVLKDDAKMDECNIKPTDFLVVMVTKAKKPAAAPTPAPAAAAAAPAAEPKTPAPAPAAASATTATTPAASSSTDTPAAPARPSAADEFPAEVVSNLTGMGFPEAEVRHCLRAASGNPDIAMEFLTNGIPPGVEAAASGAPSPAANASGSSSGGSAGGLEAFRNHPQINQLRRLVQTNPHMLQTVLTQIGQQQPDLLQAINSNQAAFLAMMNEPVTDAPAPAANAGSSSGSAAGGAGGAPGGAAGMLEGMANPAQMAQMIQSMSPAELNQMAAMMGLSADQLRQTAQMLGQIPPEQLQQYMMQAMGGGGGMGEMAGLMGGAGGGMGGPQVLRLNEEEMAAVDRLTEMGFDRAEAAQAFLACDKNEALAANLLMDGGFGFGGDNSGSGGNNNGNNNNGGGGSGGSGDNDDDAMYD